MNLYQNKTILHLLIMSQILIVDIQNTYIKYIGNHILENLPKYASQFDTIFYLYDNMNGEPFHEQIIESWLGEENESFINRLNQRTKNYGFFRSFMDAGINDEEIVELVQFMLDEKVYDSRDLMDQENQELMLKFKQKFKNHDFMNLTKWDSYPIYIPDDLVSMIQEDIRDGVVLVGGGTQACLKEIELLLQALNINYTINHEFTYT